AKARLRKLVGVTGAATEISATIVAETALTPAIWQQIARGFDADPGKTRGARFIDLVARLDPGRLTAQQLCDLFVTEDKDKNRQPRANLLNAEQRKAMPQLQPLLEAERDRIFGLDAQLAGALLVERSEAVLDVVAAIAARYDAEKRRHALLD